MRTRVKICGITRTEDARLVVESGADAIGLVFYSKSPRFVSTTQAAEINQVVPAFVSTVALFRDADEAYIQSVLEQVDIDLIQFHGSEHAGFCEQFDRPYIKALGMKSAECDSDYLNDQILKYSSAKAVLLDGHAPGEAGGTGEAFDWTAIGSVSRSTGTAIILAGGLSPENVRHAIETVKPYAVDVSSGVESSPGIKSKDKVSAFMREIAASER
jgi:phosphoribosylanthranilate isomerase